VRQAVNLANGSTLAGLGVAALGCGHEARHATQFACCGGLVMIPLYLAAAGVSWALTGDFGARNVFERRAGLADGGYQDKPLRRQLAWISGPGRRAPGPARTCPGRASAAHDESTASPSR